MIAGVDISYLLKALHIFMIRPLAYPFGLLLQ